MLFGGHRCHHKKLYTGDSLTNDELDQLYSNTDTIEFKLDMLSFPHLIDLPYVTRHYPNIKNVRIYHTDQFLLRVDFCTLDQRNWCEDVIRWAKKSLNVSYDVKIQEKPFREQNYIHMLGRLKKLHYSEGFIDDLEEFIETGWGMDHSIVNYINVMQQWNINFTGKEYLEFINER